MSFFMFGPYFAYEFFNSIPNVLMSLWQVDESVVEFRLQMINAAYSLPNVLAPFVFGFYSNRFPRSGLLLGLAGTILCGQLVVSYGVNIFPLVVLGRMLLGLGTEPLGVLQSTMVSEVFRGKELSFALSICSVITSLGPFLNDTLSPYLATILSPLWLMTVVACFAAFSALNACIVSRLSVCQIPEHDEPAILPPAPEAKELERDEPVEAMAGWSKTIGMLPVSYWILVAAIAIHASVRIAFSSIQGIYYADKYFGGDVLTARMYNSMILVISLILSPIVSLLNDNMGGAIYFALVGSVCAILSHVMALLLPTGPHIPILLLGIDTAVASLRWAMLIRIVPARQVSLGIGIAVSLSSLTTVITSVVLGLVSLHFYNAATLFAVIIGLGLLTCMLDAALTRLNQTQLQYALSLPEMSK
ncbi:hypothetical protein HDV03_000142 [Kappamyces sp. JEL0829]|nr:hypothetical protein HDV03_000142 [Kappamyces sp. JEL0829]